MPTPFWTRLVIGIAAALWLGAAIVLKAPVNATWLKPAGFVMAVVVLLLLAFDRWAWWWLPATITKRPDLRGTWKADLEYQWPLDAPLKRKECYLVIRQTYSTVSVDMLFDISASQSGSAGLVVSNGRHSLWWSYWSAATVTKREANPPHRGAAELIISATPRTRLEGDYWTDRRTLGRIVTGSRTKHLYTDYTSAKQGKYS